MRFLLNLLALNFILFIGFKVYGFFEKRHDQYIVLSKYKTGDVIYLKPDSTKVVVSGYGSLAKYVMGFNVTKHSYDVIYPNGNRLTIPQDIIYSDTLKTEE